MNDNMLDAIFKLNEMLTNAGIPHTFTALYDGMQICMFADTALTQELDSCIIHSYSRGHQNGLLETHNFGGCEGWETAEEIFDGWQLMYNQTNKPKNNHCDCTIIGAGGETWEGSAPSWD